MSDITKILSEKRCAVISVPFGVESGPAATVIAQQVADKSQSSYIVTWDKESALEIVKNAKSEATNVIDYTEIQSLESVNHSLIVFDSIGHLLTIALLLKFEGEAVLNPLLQSHNVVIILCSMGVSEDQIKRVNKIIPTASLLQASFLDLDHDIAYRMHDLQLTEVQVNAIKSKIKEDIIDETEDIQLHMQKCCNIVYPEAYEKLIAQSRPLKLTSILSNTENILENAPKMKELITSVLLNREAKQVVFTRYTQYHGVGLIAELFKKYGIRNIICQDYDLISNQVKEFNELTETGCVLVTCYPFPSKVYPTNVTHLHLIDGALHNLESLLGSIFRYKNYSITPSLTVHNYVCRDGEEDHLTPDVVAYNKSQKYVKGLFDYWDSVLGAAKHVIIGKQGQLVIRD